MYIITVSTIFVCSSSRVKTCLREQADLTYNHTIYWFTIPYTKHDYFRLLQQFSQIAPFRATGNRKPRFGNAHADFTNVHRIFCLFYREVNRFHRRILFCNIGNSIT